MRNDGAFLVRASNIAWLIKPDGNYITFSPEETIEKRSTNLISISQENGQTTMYLEENIITTNRANTGELLLKSSSKNGCLFNDNYSIRTYKTIYKLVSGKIDSYQSTNSEQRYSIISKYNGNGQLVETLKIPGLNTLQNSGSGFFTESPNANKVFAVEAKEDFIYFYRLTDSDLLSSQNRISLNSSQSGSITATVNNPEQAILNIQSSTNLIDWNTLKTIQKAPSLEIIVPANKQKEFIRAVE